MASCSSRLLPRVLKNSPDTQKYYKEHNSIASEVPKTMTSARNKLKSEISQDWYSSKKKGINEYYSEGVICDLGGNLLCCDSSQTFHIECLDPPLKTLQAPMLETPRADPKSVASIILGGGAGT